MEFNSKHKLSYDNFVFEKTVKKQIVLGNVYSNSTDYVKNNAELTNNKDHPTFSISRSGEVFQHYGIEKYSNFTGTDIDYNAISVGLLNLGYLFEKEGKIYDIYNNLYTEDIFTKTWKNCTHWQPYTEEQLNSAIELCNYILSETNIVREVISINVYKKDITNFNGITYRSNHNIKHFDVSPAWDFKSFKTKITTNE